MVSSHTRLTFFVLCVAFLPVVKSYSEAVPRSSFFTYNKSEPLGRSFMGDDRMDSRLEQGFCKIPEMCTSPSFHSAAVGLLPREVSHSAPKSS